MPLTRREVVGALLALFGGVLVPEPVREVIRVVRPTHDAFYGYARFYCELAIRKPSSAGIIVQVAAPTTAELKALQRGVVPESELLRLFV